MHITLVDDSVPFDGYTASARPLGGTEKAFAALPGALSRRGHTVAVFNRCRWSMTIEGAHWDSLDGRKPLATDVLIALRKPSLLQFVRQAKRRVLWHTGPGRMLERAATRNLLTEHQALVLLVSQAQAGPGSAALLPPAVRGDFLGPEPCVPDTPPHAIATTHPAHGLDWLLDLWIGRIRPLAPTAELHLYSMSLAKAAEGGSAEPEPGSIAAKVLAAGEHGIRVVRPQGDPLMAQALRRARVHLYPGHADDVTAFTLMESQAAGLPAVVRPLGAAPERIAHGLSGMVAPDDDAFANLAAMLLGDDGMQASYSAEARARSRGWDWDAAAAALEGALT
jgi:glycosyltransferase involved in cell wall biosynthesis